MESRRNVLNGSQLFEKNTMASIVHRDLKYRPSFLQALTTAPKKFIQRVQRIILYIPHWYNTRKQFGLSYIAVRDFRQ